MARKKPIEFRCSHNRTDSDPAAFDTRQERLDARRTLYEVPADASWEPVIDFDPAKKQPYEVGTYKATVTCPGCGAECVVVTDRKVG